MVLSSILSSFLGFLGIKRPAKLRVVCPDSRAVGNGQEGIFEAVDEAVDEVEDRTKGCS